MYIAVWLTLTSRNLMEWQTRAWTGGLVIYSGPGLVSVTIQILWLRGSVGDASVPAVEGTLKMNPKQKGQSDVTVCLSLERKWSRRKVLPEGLGDGESKISSSEEFHAGKDGILTGVLHVAAEWFHHVALCNCSQSLRNSRVRGCVLAPTLRQKSFYSLGSATSFLIIKFEHKFSLWWWRRPRPRRGYRLMMLNAILFNIS